MRSLVCLTCAWALALPSLAHASPPTSAIGSEPPHTPEPPRGRKLYGWGIFGVTFGIFNLGYGIPIAITGPGDAYSTGYIPITFGASFIALGAAGIHYGKRRKKVWKAWHEHPNAPLLDLRPPPAPAHVPWLIVGGVTTPLALATIGLSIPPMLDPVLNTPPGAYVVLAWGAASLTASIAMLAHGAAMARRHHEPRVALVPTGWTTREGFGVGLAGRF